MRHADYSSPRIHNHLQPDLNSSHPHIHIFPLLPHSSLITTLIEHLQQRSTTFRTHQRHQEFEDILKSSNENKQRVIVLVEVGHNNSNESPTIFPRDYPFPKVHPYLNLQFISAEDKSYMQLPGLRSLPDILQFCQRQLRKGSSHKIHLRSVRSLNSSREYTLKTQTSLSKLKGGVPQYETLFFQIDNYLPEEGDAFLKYQQLVASLETIERTASFRSVRQLKTKIFQNKRFLVLTGTNHLSQKTVKDIHNEHLGKLDILVLGDLALSNFYLDPAIILATHDPSNVLAFLKSHGFDSPAFKQQERRFSNRFSFSSTDFKNLMNKIMVEDSDYSSSSNNIFKSTFRSGAVWKPKTTRHWRIDKDEQTRDHFSTQEILDSNVSYQGDKRKVKKIKNSVKPEIVGSGEVHNQLFINSGEQQPGFSINRNSQENFIQSQVRQVNGASTKDIGASMGEVSDRLAQQKESPTHREESSTQKSAVMIQPMFTYEKNKFQAESAIPEMSEEYQPSKKSSVMNAEADFSNRTFRNQLSSQYQDFRNRQEEQSFRFSSNSIAQSPQKPSNSHSISDHNMQVTTPSNSRVGFQSPGHSSHRSPMRVIKKQDISGPEEVQYRGPMSNSNIGLAPNAQTQNQHSKESSSKSTVPASSEKKNNEKREANLFSRRKDVNPILARTVQRQAHTATHALSTSPQVTQHQTQVLSPNKPVSPVSGLKQTPAATGSKETENKSLKAVIPTAFQHSFAKNFQGFERIEKDGVVVYRRKVAQRPNVDGNTAGQFQGRIKPVQPVLKPNPQEQLMKAQYPSNYPFAITKEPEKQQNKPVPKQEDPKIIKSPQKLRQGPAESAKKGSPIGTVGSDRKRELLTSPRRNFMNESMLSRMSELHSDGSILRRNNMRFGVKVAPKEKLPQPSMLFQESKLKSGIYKAVEDNRKNVINRAILGEEHLQEEKSKLFHIDPKVNNFHFIIHEELAYLNVILKQQLASPHDKIDSCASIENMYECLRPEKVREFYDAGFIFTLSTHTSMINPKILPEDYYMVVIDRNKGAVLEISEDSRRIRIDHLRLLPLVQKIILDTKLYQYVAYRSERKEIAVLADKFLNSEFILQKVETEYTSEIIDFYYCELPRLTRLYILCQEQELAEIIKLLGIYKQFNPSFRAESCKIICLISNILGNDELILKHPNVTFINNPEEIKNQTDILRYAHYSEDSAPAPLVLDTFHYPQKYLQLPQRLEHAFPGRFDPLPYLKLSQVYSRLDKIKGKKGRHYLLLPEGGPGQKLITQSFTRIFMLGKGKSIQSSMVRVLNLDELVELLRYY